MAVTRRNPERANMVKKAHELREAGRSNVEIARLLDIAPSTVSTYFTDPTGKKAIAFQRKYTTRRKAGERIVTMAERSAARQKRIQRALVLIKKGISHAEIAEELGVSRAQIGKYLADPTGERERKRRRFNRTGVYETREDAEVAFNRMDLPISTKITMRPVWKRRQRRIYGQNSLPPPNEDECRDAIRILGDERLQRDAPALYFEAFTIFDEGGR